MAYKYKQVTVASHSHLIDEVKSVLLSAGWTDETPTGQDDPNGLILGHFLKSTGEDGNQNILVHLSLNWGYAGQGPVLVSYLSSDIDATQTSIDVLDVASLTSTGTIRIGDEIIEYTGISGNTLTGCTRGWGLTTAAAHSANDPVQFIYQPSVYTGVFQCELFCHRDLNNAIAASDATVTWSLGRDSATGITGLDGYGDGRFSHNVVLLRVNDPSSPEYGKMRFIRTSNDAGDFTYQPFLAAPGAVTCDIVSGGFLPCFSRQSTSGGYRKLGCLRSSLSASGTATWIYASKDGFWVIQKISGSYYFAYFGNCIPYADPTNAHTTADVAAGALTVTVDNPNIFIVGAKYRIISQDYRDWDDNKDRQVVDGWDPLDPDEISMEEVVVAGISGNDITFTNPLIYSYRAGAIIGEDPVPAVRYGKHDGNYMMGISALVAPYLATPKGEIPNHASHRSRWRAHHEYNNPKTPYSGNQSGSMYDVQLAMQPMHSDPLNNQNSQTDRLPLMLVVIDNDTQNSGYGYYYAGKGVFPFGCWESYQKPPLGGSSEDTVEAMWQGQPHTFRIFQETYSGRWFIFGPEIP